MLEFFLPQPKHQPKLRKGLTESVFSLLRVVEVRLTKRTIFQFCLKAICTGSANIFYH